MISETKLHELLSNLDNLLLRLQTTFSEQIAPFDNSQNLFHIVSVEHMEIKHSNLLAWLLDPIESHHLNDMFFKCFMTQLMKKYGNKIDRSILTKNWTNSIVLREYEHIDILLHNPSNLLNLVIENKIDSHEHGTQLKDYEDVIHREYSHPECKNIYVFLTLNDEIPSENKWLTMNYIDIIHAIEETLTKTSNIEPKVRIVLEDYVNLLKELTNFDLTQKQQIAMEIWRQHRQALEFLNQYRFDPNEAIKDDFIKVLTNNWQKYQLQFQKKDSDQYHIRFKTSRMNNWFNDQTFDAQKVAWNNNAKYYYELVINSDNKSHIYGQISFKLDNCEQDVDLNKMRQLGLSPDGKNWLIHKFSLPTMERDFYDNLHSFSPRQIEEECQNAFQTLIEKITTFENKYNIK